MTKYERVGTRVYEKKPVGRPPERLTVVINFKMALATPPEVETVTWPKNWPLPSVGDEVQIGNHRGFVTYLTFAPIDGVLAINTR